MFSSVLFLSCRYGFDEDKDKSVSESTANEVVEAQYANNFFNEVRFTFARHVLYF